MKKSLLILLLFVAIIFTGCFNNSEKPNPGKDFKDSYESLNGKERNGKEYRKLDINEKNPFDEVNPSYIIDKMDNKETFYVYFGDKQCPWCRSVIEKAIEVANDNSIDKIYYVAIWDDEHNEILRDTYKLDDNNKPVLNTEGTDTYKQLLEKFDKVLSDYTLKDSNGNTVQVGEKRIYAPNFIYVEKGVPVRMTEGISEKQTGAFDELTEEILKDEEKLFSEFFVSYCDDKC